MKLAHCFVILKVDHTDGGNNLHLSQIIIELEIFDVKVMLPSMKLYVDCRFIEANMIRYQFPTVNEFHSLLQSDSPLWSDSPGYDPDCLTTILVNSEVRLTLSSRIQGF